MAERDLIEPAGLPDRPWYRHVVYAPGLYTGYGVKTIPGVREAVDAGNYTRAAEQAQIVIRALQRATRTLMAIDRQGTGLAHSADLHRRVLSVRRASARCAWFTDTSLLAGQLAGWTQAVPARIVEPRVSGARGDCRMRRISRALVPLGEMVSGVGADRRLLDAVVRASSRSSWR